MVKSYNDPVKQKSREKLRDFIAKNLLSFKKPRDIKVVCFPGAEVEGEEALEVKQVYDPLNIPRENIVGLEYNLENAKKLKKASLGIKVVNSLDLDFFKNSDRVFDIISLDYTGYRDESKWLTLHQIAGRQRLYGNGILATNYSGRRESSKSQDQMFTLFLGCHPQSNDWGIDDIEKKIKDYENGFKPNLSEIRDILTNETLIIMRMGTSALFPIPLLSNHKYYNTGQKILQKFEKEIIQSKENIINFILSNRPNSGMDNRGPTSPLSYYYRIVHMELLSHFITEKNKVNENMAKFFTQFLVNSQMKAYFPREIERYSYISNKNTTMDIDLFSFISADRLYRKLKSNIFYNINTGKLTIMNMGIKRTAKILEEILKNKDINYSLPERIYLGSSWQPSKRKERISKEDAIYLLREGCSPAEISECYKGFTTKQLGAFKAHYITMGKDLVN